MEDDDVIRQRNYDDILELLVVNRNLLREYKQSRARAEQKEPEEQGFYFCKNTDKLASTSMPDNKCLYCGITKSCDQTHHTLPNLKRFSEQLDTVTIADLVKDPRIPEVSRYTPVCLHWNDEIPPFTGFIDADNKIHSWWGQKPRFIGDPTQFILFRHASPNQWIVTLTSLMENDFRYEGKTKPSRPGCWRLVTLGPSKDSISLFSLKLRHIEPLFQGE